MHKYVQEGRFQKCSSEEHSFVYSDPWFLPLLILRIIGLIEDRLQGGRWVMVIMEKVQLNEDRPCM